MLELKGLYKTFNAGTVNEKRAIDGLDLTALTEFKRSASGAVEIKLSDRAALLERIYRLMQEDEDAGEAFLRALEGDGNST